jgi:hypothetical protein
MIKEWISIFLVTSSISFAVKSPFSVNNLPLIIENPNSFSPDEYYTESPLDHSYLFYKWEWRFDTSKPETSLILSKTKDNKGWRLRLDFSDYKIDELAKNRTALYGLKNVSMKRAISVYKISFGRYENVYLKQTIFEDGSSFIDLQNLDYVTYEAESSSFEKGGRTYLLEYDVYSYLFLKSKFCSMEDRFGSVQCEK